MMMKGHTLATLAYHVIQMGLGCEETSRDPPADLGGACRTRYIYRNRPGASLLRVETQLLPDQGLVVCKAGLE